LLIQSFQNTRQLLLHRYWNRAASSFLKTTAAHYIIMHKTNGTEEKHYRHDFLIERIAFFSDAVFAIAITLMIIEIHPPIIERGDTEAIAWHKFREIIPEFIGLFVSFLLIGGTWFRHHKLFMYADKYDRRFMQLNMVLLFTIVLFP